MKSFRDERENESFFLCRIEVQVEWHVLCTVKMTNGKDNEI
jgi:hypothetical protein